MSFPHHFCGIFVAFGLLISLGLEKFILNILIYARKGHFCSWKGERVLLEKSYQKKRSEMKQQESVQVPWGCLTLRSTLLPPHLSRPNPHSLKKWLLLFLSGFHSQEMHGKKGSCCLVMVQLSKRPLKVLQAFMDRHTDKSKTCASPCRAFRHWDASGGSGHSELGLHSRLLNSRKAIILGIYFVEPVWEHLQIWRWDCPGLHATCRNLFKAVKRHKNTSWGQHLRCLFCHCLSKKPAQNNQANQKQIQRSTEDMM